MSRVYSPGNDTGRRRATVVVALVVTVCCSLINISRSSIYHPRSLFVPEKSKTKEPMVILHIGPHKTATTTIQCDLSYYQHQLHDESNVTFLGRMGSRSCRNKRYGNADFTYNFEMRSILGNCDDKMMSSCLKKREPVLLERHLRELSSQNKTILISDEAFSRMSPKSQYGNHRTIFSLLEKYYPGRVKVVIVYRRYYDWIVSKYNQENKPYFNGRGTYLPQSIEWPSGGPSAGGSQARNAITFSAYYRNLQRSVSMDPESLVDDYVVLAHSKDLHPVEYLRDIYLKYTDQIQILNLHDMQSDATDVTTHFLREVFPSMTIPKDDDRNTDQQYNPSRNFDFDILAVAAKRKGFTGKLSRPRVAKYAEKHLQEYLEGKDRELANPLPLRCLDDAQFEDFLKRTLEYERRLFPDKQSTDLEKSFREADLKKKFCNIDAERLLSSKAVEQFFRAKARAEADRSKGSYDY